MDAIAQALRLLRLVRIVKLWKRKRSHQRAVAELRRLADERKMALQRMNDSMRPAGLSPTAAAGRGGARPQLTGWGSSSLRRMSQRLVEAVGSSFVCCCLPRRCVPCVKSRRGSVGPARRGRRGSATTKAMTALDDFGQSFRGGADMDDAYVGPRVCLLVVVVAECSQRGSHVCLHINTGQGVWQPSASAP